MFHHCYPIARDIPITPYLQKLGQIDVQCWHYANLVNIFDSVNNILFSLELIISSIGLVFDVLPLN